MGKVAGKRKRVEGCISDHVRRAQIPKLSTKLAVSMVHRREIERKALFTMNVESGVLS